MYKRHVLLIYTNIYNAKNRFRIKKKPETIRSNLIWYTCTLLFVYGNQKIHPSHNTFKRDERDVLLLSPINTFFTQDISLKSILFTLLRKITRHIVYLWEWHTLENWLIARRHMHMRISFTNIWNMVQFGSLLKQF